MGVFKGPIENIISLGNWVALRSAMGLTGSQTLKHCATETANSSVTAAGMGESHDTRRTNYKELQIQIRLRRMTQEIFINIRNFDLSISARNYSI